MAKTNMDCSSCGGQHICCSQQVVISKLESQKLGLENGELVLVKRGEVCRFFDVGSAQCSIYHRRPMVCRDFNCCNPKQIKVSSGYCPPEELEKIKKELQPETWLGAEMQIRKQED